MGFALNSADEPLKALENIKIAIRLNPISPPVYLTTLGWSYVLLKKYEKAIEVYKTVLKHHPNQWYAYLSLVIPYAYSGQEKNAEIAVNKFLNFVPDYTITRFKQTSVFTKNREVRLEKAVKAFRKAGLPE
jgi:tetratricopeptide (TPR) repeat protein